ncbi:MAG: Asp/Glu/hydantoin racemase [Ignavibacteriae bacterium]|nr:Asp/Glu/hydantoin racemase [Ignavibacteriota bacterium]NOG99365.1 Asp/Glu/hydantoin racemase [Ignavibacteriota bacterium]
MKSNIKLSRTLPAIIILAFIFFNACTTEEQPKQKITDVILSDKDSYFYVDTSAYPKERRRLPIGVFDSGTGGLTVLDAIANFDNYNNLTKSLSSSSDNVRDFQEEYFIYLGDQANMPYGNYSKENKVDLLKEHIIKDVQFLLDKKYYDSQAAASFESDKEPVKAIVVACNTATAYGLEEIREFMSNSGLNLPVIGVIDAGVKGALSTIGKDENATVGIMATAGTVSSKGYVKALNYWKEKYGYEADITAFQQAGIGLAGAIDGAANYINKNAELLREDYKGPAVNNSEAQIDITILDRYDFNRNGNELLTKGDKSDMEDIQINSVQNYIKYHVVSLLEKIRKSETNNKLTSIILGCTHYPYYINDFKAEFNRLYNYKENGKNVYRNFMNEDIDFIDPAVNTSKELFEYLAEEELFNNSDISKSEFYISAANKHNKNNILDSAGLFPYEYKYGRNAGFIQEYVRRLPFSKQSIDDEIAKRLEESIPFTFSLIREFNRSNKKMNFLKENEKL